MIVAQRKNIPELLTIVEKHRKVLLLGCGTCVTVCPYTAPFCNKDGKGQIEAAKCMGCGICAAECPARAIQLHHFESDQFEVMIKALFAADFGWNGENDVATPRHSTCLVEEI